MPSSLLLVDIGLRKGEQQAIVHPGKEPVVNEQNSCHHRGHQQQHRNQLGDCRKAEATGRLNVGFAYTFGGKNFTPATAKVDQAAINDEVNKYRAELAQAQTDLANTKNALANAQKETVTKEVIKEVQVAGPRAIFFKLGSAQIDDYGKVNIQLAAKILKANPDKKYKIAGYADKATGSSAVNQKLSERRAQAVYDALIAEGVDENQIELVGFGGTDNMFGKDYLNRVVIME